MKKFTNEREVENFRSDNTEPLNRGQHQEMKSWRKPRKIRKWGNTEQRKRTNTRGYEGHHAATEEYGRGRAISGPDEEKMSDYSQKYAFICDLKEPRNFAWQVTMGRGGVKQSFQILIIGQWSLFWRQTYTTSEMKCKSVNKLRSKIYIQENEMDAKMIRRNPPNCRSRPSSLKGRKCSKKGTYC